MGASDEPDQPTPTLDATVTIGAAGALIAGIGTLTLTSSGSSPPWGC
jgi:hypothetical protein